MTEQVIIFDTTLRDGEQSPGASMNAAEKMRLAIQLEKLGVDVMEAGFPAASEGDHEAVSQIAGKLERTEVTGLARTSKGDIDRAWDAICHAAKPRIHTFIATSDIHMDYKLKMSRDEVVKSTVDAVKYAKSFTDNVEFSAEDGSRSDRDFLCKVFVKFHIPLPGRKLRSHYALRTWRIAKSQYRFEKYNGKLTYFKASEYTMEHEQNPKLWQSVVLSDFKLYTIPGKHLDLLKEPNVKILSKLIKNIIKFFFSNFI